MTAYLLPGSGPMPFSGADICAELGIDPAKFAPALEDMIAVACCDSPNPITRSVWWISEGPRFDEEAKHGNCSPTSIGAPFEYQGRTFRECTYEPRDWAVAIVRKAVIAKARSSEDVSLSRAIAAADDRKRVGARAELRGQLQASVVEAA